MSINSILVVDDSDIDQYLAKYMIEQIDSSIQIQQAYDGQEALELLYDSKQSPDIILLDINMPRMNGLEFLDNYEASITALSRVVMLTSSDQASDKQKSLSHSCVTHYFTKPFEKTDLEALLA